MFGAFRSTPIASGGLLWKTPWRLSPTRKANHRKRMKRVDDVIAAVAASGVQTESLTKALELPKESEMDPRDKYWTFNVHSRGYRRSVHKEPKWTRLTFRTNPKGF